MKIIRTVGILLFAVVGPIGVIIQCEWLFLSAVAVGIMLQILSVALQK